VSILVSGPGWCHAPRMDPRFMQQRHLAK
jgi:hypothetical protein